MLCFYASVNQVGYDYDLIKLNLKVLYMNLSGLRLLDIIKLLCYNIYRNEGIIIKLAY